MVQKLRVVLACISCTTTQVGLPSLPLGFFGLTAHANLRRRSLLTSMGPQTDEGLQIRRPAPE